LFSTYIYHLIDTQWALTHATTSVLQDFADDGVVYLELRTTPRALPSAGLDKAGYIETVLDAIEAFESSTSSSLHARLILSVDRRDSVSDAFEVIDLAERFRLRGVVGVDLCGDPSRGDVASLAPAFERARAVSPRLGITLHFAEAEASGSDAELTTLLSWQPDRLGHVIHVSPEVKKMIADRGGMGLELCLSCNVHAGMISGGFEAHHFGEWWRVDSCVVVLGVSIFQHVILCKQLTVPETDDVGVFGSPLSNEYALVAEHFRLTRSDICALVRKGVDVIFGDKEEKQRLRGILWTS
jgi:adenosine deaminase